MKKIFNLLFMSLAVALYSSCTSEEEDLFDQSSAARIEAAIKADKEILTGAANGWLMEYYPSSSQQYGGYTILVSFAEDGNATVASDALDADQTATSTYSLKQSAGVILSFDTYNEVMHFFSDPKNPAGIGTNGKGMEGDFEFNIMEASKEKVVMVGRKTQSRIVMTPLADGVVWKDFLTKIQDADEIYSSFVAFKYVEGSFEASATVSYRNITITYDEGDASKTINAPYIITEEGNLKFYEPITLNGKTIDELKYLPDDKYGTFVPIGEVNGVFTPKYPLTYQLLNGDWYFAMSGLGDPNALARWDVIKTQIIPQLAPLNYVLFTPYDDKFIVFYWDCGGAIGYLLFDTVTAGDYQVSLSFAYSGNSVGVKFWNDYYWNYMVYPFNDKTFALSADNEENPTVITMTDKSNPQNAIKLYKEEILDPFNN
ncbi:MAG: DUF4302 domain-containing protein [Bacteroides sp.]|nr:DUF4302 domain-containing protein [Bacteroides sp.]